MAEIVAFYWEHLGPYHFGRFNALKALNPHARLVELADNNQTYGWNRSGTGVGDFDTLFPGRLAESISANKIFFAMRRYLIENRVEVLFVPSFWPAYTLAAAFAAQHVGCRLVFMTESHYASGNNSGISFAIKRHLLCLYDSAFVGGSLHRSFVRSLGMRADLIFDGYDSIDNAHFTAVAEAARLDEVAYREKLRLPAKYILSLGRMVKKKNLEMVVRAYANLVAQGKHEGNHLVFVGSGEMQLRLIDLALERGLRVVLPALTNSEGYVTNVGLPEKLGKRVAGIAAGRRKADGPVPGGRRVSDPQVSVAVDAEGGLGGGAKGDGVMKEESKVVREDAEISKDTGGVLTLGGAVHFYPFAQIDTVPVYYALASCFVLASTTEEWGLVVNEAMACGCPVAVSRSVGSSLDLVVPGVTGYRFVAESVHELTWCLEKLCGDPNEAQRMGRQGLAHIGDWSNERFARNAVLAAGAALRGPQLSGWGRLKRVFDGPTGDDSKVRDLAALESIWFLQTCFPDYRTGVFARVHERLGDSFRLFSGKEYFSSDIKMTPDFRDWHALVVNRFLLGRRLLWQQGAVDAMLHADVVVMELNPRILSTWVILALRSLWGAPTVLWGHAWRRSDRWSLRNVLRLYMMRLASATITYTQSQRDEVKRVAPRLRVYAATNSLIRAAECNPLLVPVERLDTILYVGRLNGPKKPELLLEAFSRAKLPARARLVLVGSGEALTGLERRVVAEGLGKRVLLPGHVHNHSLLRELYGQSFCAVSPGYVGLGAIQAFSFGVPLVLADAEPHAPEVEACHEGQNTVHFKANDADGLAAALERMWADREHWLARRSTLADWTARNYSVENMVEGFVEAIDAVRSKGVKEAKV